ncbi:hypothetical protein [Sphingomonas mucosissima]|uniref:Glycosyltransferase RgtA/B/C/D-like domain-containing protein n=1 Tax=Sphingomonas mucosissima TaxID=370959 RepID=A0A245ZR37_9SPHN|nr:hypothetical protein [Sphingomonas mucosissima]OWK32207.1 hypothetical protein SPMU_05290 [Sphingomonas mucosissima]
MPGSQPSSLTPTQADEGGILRPVLVAWIIASFIFVMIGARDILVLRLSDPDDAMRLLQVKDWLAGQSWWDVGQHRLNHGRFPMHWSRLVDLPLAVILVAATPMLGDALATRLAMTIVPLLLMLSTMLLVAWITRRNAGIEAARYAALLTPLSLPLIVQLRPLRVDHHGWQIVLALVAVACLLHRPTARHGLLAGLALAALLTISLEGLPIAASIAAVAAAAWVWDPARRPFLVAMMWSLAGAAICLHLATRGPDFFLPACDAISPAWLLTLAVGTLATTAAGFLAGSTLVLRLAALGGAGAVTGAALLFYAPQCLAGPFATLPGLTYQLWYLNVLEGRPVWQQPVYQAYVTMAVPFVGLVATVGAWRKAEAEGRARWATLLAVLVAAVTVTIFVDRAGATANALAIPGVATLLLALLIRARTIPHVVVRTGATAAALIAASPGYLAVAALAVDRSGDPLWQAKVKSSAAGETCALISDIRTVAELPPGLIFAPLDVSPEIISTTNHRAIGAGYHRSPGPMTTVIGAFVGQPQQARATILASGADYVAACPGLSETNLYQRRFPDGFWARLEGGERFDWLEPVAVRGPARAWRVNRPLPSPARRP